MHEFYKISADRLTEIADRIRVMAGLKRKMTPAEMIEWLSKVKFTPSTVGECKFTLNFESMSVGRVPDVVKGIATSNFALNFESTAIGALQEE